MVEYRQIKYRIDNISFFQLFGASSLLVLTYFFPHAVMALGFDPNFFAFIPFLFAAAVFFAFAFVSERFGLAIALVLLPLHISPSLDMWAGLPVRGVAFYFLIPVVFGVVSSWLSGKKIVNDPFSRLLIKLLVGLVFTAAISIIFAPRVLSGEESFFEVQGPGTYAYGIARVALLVILALALICIRDVVRAEQGFFYVDAAILGWVIAVVIGLLGFAIIILGFDVGGFRDFTLTHRPTSTFFYVTSAAGYIAVVLPLVAFRLKTLIMQSRSFIVFFLTVMVFGAILVVVATTSRSGVILLLSNGAAFSVFLFRSKFLGLFGVCILALTVVSSMLWSYPPRTVFDGDLFDWDLFEGGGQSIGQTSYVVQRLGDNHQQRLDLARNAISLGWQYPLLGVGVGMIRNHEVSGVLAFDSHNFLIDAFVEMGAIGLLLFVAFFGCVAWNVVRARDDLFDPDGGALFCALVVFGIFFLYSFHTVFLTAWSWSLLGVALGFRDSYKGHL